VAVCTLADRGLADQLRGSAGVGLAGPLMTANLGIEQVIWAVLERPAIRHLLVCGTDSPLFRAGASLVALVTNGMSALDRRIIGATGYRPYLRSVEPAEVAAFRLQVELADLRGVSEPGSLRRQVLALAHGPGDEATGCTAGLPMARREFTMLAPGGRRERVADSGGGFFVISADHRARQIVVEHYLPDLRPAHRMRGVRAESMLLGLLRAGVIDQPSHAGYLGAELAKAETALRLGLDYEQDKPLRRRSA
jgi:tetrahydromethanopterin S-methyltransferase subunit A